MSSNRTFDFHVVNVSKRCSNLTRWIIRTFSTRETTTIMTLFQIPRSVSIRLCLTIMVSPLIKVNLYNRDITNTLQASKISLMVSV